VKRRTEVGRVVGLPFGVPGRHLRMIRTGLVRAATGATMRKFCMYTLLRKSRKRLAHDTANLHGVDWVRRARYICSVNETSSAPGWGALFWTAFERSANPMALLGSDRVNVRINDAFAAAFGYPPDQLVGRRADLFVPPDARKQMETDWAVLLRTGRSFGHVVIAHADGQRVDAQFAAHREAISGEHLVLFVVLGLETRPMSLSQEGKVSGTRLTQRELEVVAQIAMGRTRAQIAEELFITPATVKTHCRRAMEKTGAKSQAQLVAIALATGMLDRARVIRALS
jgi:PAS domain S-box-containing protein